MEYAIDYAKKRRAFGTKLSNFETIRFKIAEMYQKVETSRPRGKRRGRRTTGSTPRSAPPSRFYATGGRMMMARSTLSEIAVIAGKVFTLRIALAVGLTG